ncbi:hypothetical protein TNCV_1513071 [Trichonephila clavipes]|nr:hypothetical protein TNCV_1513071 [Trichonephila clavipes]
MELGEEDRISSSIAYLKNLTSLTSSKYIEFNGQVPLSEWTRTASLKKKSSIPNPLAHGEKAGQILDRIDDPEKDLLVLRTKNWKTLVGRRLVRKRLFEKAKASPSLLGCRATEEGRIQNSIPGVGIKSISINWWTAKTFWGDRLKILAASHKKRNMWTINDGPRHCGPRHSDADDT